MIPLHPDDRRWLAVSEEVRGGEPKRLRRAAHRTGCSVQVLRAGVGQGRPSGVAQQVARGITECELSCASGSVVEKVSRKSLRIVFTKVWREGPRGVINEPQMPAKAILDVMAGRIIPRFLDPFFPYIIPSFIDPTISTTPLRARGARNGENCDHQS